MATGADVISLSRFSGAFTRPRGKKRLNALMDSEDPGREVAALSVQDLFTLVSDVGIESALEIVALATPEQLQGCLDLQVWEGDRIDPERADTWLAALVEAGPQRLAHVWENLDAELTAFLLARSTRIYDLSEEEIPDAEEPPFFATPDKLFMVKLLGKTSSQNEEDEEANAQPGDDDRVKLVERILDHLYRVDGAMARHTLRQARSETLTYLEEQAYTWRTARMADLGYAPWDEALAVFQPIDIEALRQAKSSEDRPGFVARLPVPLADATFPVGFLGQVLRQVHDAHEAERLETALLVLCNKVAAADRVDPGDIEALTASAHRAAGTLAIGLETIARGDVAAGVSALGRLSLSQVHRAGATVLGKLVTLAQSLGPAAHFAEAPYDDVMSALVGKRPLFAEAIAEVPSAGTRPLASVDDVSRTMAALARLGEKLQLLFEEWDAEPTLLGPDVTLDDLGRTALVRAVMGLEPPVAPVTTGDLSAFAARLAGDEASAVRAAALAAAPERFRMAVASWLAELGERLGGIDPEALDARFAGVLVAQRS